MASTIEFILALISILSIHVVNALESQCLLENYENQIVKRMFNNRTIDGMEAAYQIVATGLHHCDTLCSSKLSTSCLGFSFTNDSKTCLIFNTTNLKYHLSEKQMTDTVLILPEYCKERGIWSPWSVIHSDGGSLGWSSHFYKRSCFESAEGCDDAICINGQRNHTIFCNDFACLNNSEAINVTETGVYAFNISGIFKPIYVEVDDHSIAWIHIQRRFDGSVDFYRDWNSYKIGFGDVSAEFWLGNDIIHALTKGGNAMIRFDLFDGEEWRYADYDHFLLEDESQWYRLTLGSYSGNAGNSFSYHNGKRFTTKDADNDRSIGNCAVLFEGAWWFKACHSSHLNGLYLNGSITAVAQGMRWAAWKGSYFSLLETIMKVRFH